MLVWTFSIFYVIFLCVTAADGWAQWIERKVYIENIILYFTISFHVPESIVSRNVLGENLTCFEFLGGFMGIFANFMRFSIKFTYQEPYQ